MCARADPLFVFDEKTGKRRINPRITQHEAAARLLRWMWRNALERVGLWRYGYKTMRAEEERRLCRIERQLDEIGEEVSYRQAIYEKANRKGG